MNAPADVKRPWWRSLWRSTTSSPRRRAAFFLIVLGLAIGGLHAYDEAQASPPELSCQIRIQAKVYYDGAWHKSTGDWSPRTTVDSIDECVIP